MTMQTGSFVNPAATVEMAPSLVPDRSAIDFEHLARMTGGDDGTMLEILRIFDLQADLLLARITSEAPRAVAARSHTLADSARSVGAWRVLEAAIELERVALAPGPVALNSSISRLSAALSEAQVKIDCLRRDGARAAQRS
jgi:HPt (histidine-containing phosphotransfer) domain-containing protein